MSFNVIPRNPWWIDDSSLQEEASEETTSNKNVQLKNPKTIREEKIRRYRMISYNSFY